VSGVGGSVSRCGSSTPRSSGTGSRSGARGARSSGRPARRRSSSPSTMSTRSATGSSLEALDAEYGAEPVTVRTIHGEGSGLAYRRRQGRGRRGPPADGLRGAVLQRRRPPGPAVPRRAPPPALHRAGRSSGSRPTLAQDLVVMDLALDGDPARSRPGRRRHRDRRRPHPAARRGRADRARRPLRPRRGDRPRRHPLPERGHLDRTARRQGRRATGSSRPSRGPGGTSRSARGRTSRTGGCTTSRRR
jgi:hypothetical protein